MSLLLWLIKHENLHFYVQTFYNNQIDQNRNHKNPFSSGSRSFCEWKLTNCQNTEKEKVTPNTGNSADKNILDS